MSNPRSSHILLLWFAVVALLGGRALFPAGWMPITGEGGVRIALCSGSGPVIATIDGEGRVHTGEDQPQARHDSCAFAVLAHAADLPAAARLPDPGLLPALPPQPLRHDAWEVEAHAPRPPTRGPPALA